MSHSLYSVLFLFAVALSASAADVSRPQGQNCNLTSPPRGAGEVLNHGLVLRVFPHAREIGPTYTGCHVVFAPDGKQWVVLSLVEVTAGDPVRVWSAHETDPKRRGCRFKNGQVVSGDANICPMPEFLLVRSLAEGCTQKRQAAMSQSDPGASPPPGCEFE